MVALGLITGVVLTITSKDQYIDRVVYHYDKSLTNELDERVLNDTLVRFKQLLIRNFTSSGYDSIPDDNNIYSELKIQTDQILTKKEVREQARSFIDDPEVVIDFISDREQIRQTQYIAYGALTGLFFGLLITFVLSRRKA